MSGVLAVTPALRRTAQLLALVVAALLLGASATITSAAAQAAQVTVTLTAEGPTPEFIEVPVGGTVVFTNGDDTRHQVTATQDGTAWEYDSGILEVGATSAPTEPFTEPGRYTFNDARGLLLPENIADEIGVRPAASPSPSPSGEPASSGSPSGEPSPSGSPSDAPAADGGSPAPSDPASPGAPPPAGGTGATTPLSLDGGFAGTGTAPVPIPGDPLAPAIAPPLPGIDEGPAPLPYIAAPLETSAPSVAALPTGSLPGADTGRDRGLPAVLAALLVVGIASMLVRVLLAEPAARRTGEASRGVRPVVVTG
jgi:plastocyanin